MKRRQPVIHKQRRQELADAEKNDDDDDDGRKKEEENMKKTELKNAARVSRAEGNAKTTPDDVIALQIPPLPKSRWRSVGRFQNIPSSLVSYIYTYKEKKQTQIEGTSGGMAKRFMF